MPSLNLGDVVELPPTSPFWGKFGHPVNDGTCIRGVVVRVPKTEYNSLDYYCVHWTGPGMGPRDNDWYLPSYLVKVGSIYALGFNPTEAITDITRT